MARGRGSEDKKMILAANFQMLREVTFKGAKFLAGDKCISLDTHHCCPVTVTFQVEWNYSTILTRSFNSICL